MNKAKVTDLRKHYPELSPDKWEARVDCACLYRPEVRRLADRLDPSYKT
jgi:hypothetical protein